MSFPLQDRTETDQLFQTRSTCRLCASQDLQQLWSFGTTPLANAYLKPEQIGQSEAFVPLTVSQCATCHLVQMPHVVSPEILFANYHYLSSTSPSFVAHFVQYAQALRQRFHLTEQSLVVDIGSNDGVLLKPLRDAGIRVLGIEPAQNIAAMALTEGIETIAQFFTPPLASALASSHGQADIITANNVFAHTDTVDVFVAAVRTLLKPEGVFIFEVQYLGDLVEKNLFDIVYHEHLCYYHLTPLIPFFAAQGLQVFDVERQDVHGGSLRVFVQHQGGPHHPSARLSQILAAEEQQGLNRVATYTDFAKRVAHNKHKLQTLIRTLKNDGKRIVGYGAPAKATTLLYAFDIDHILLDYIVDDDKKIKQGLVMPGNHIPIVAPEKLYKDKPDYCLILAWNFAQPIIQNHQRFTAQGGQFIIPIPEPTVV